MTKAKFFAVSILLLCAPLPCYGQKHEVAFTSGALKSGDHDFIFPRPGRIRTSTGFTFQLNYAQRFADARIAALYSEFALTVTPRTKIETSNAFAPRSYSTIYFTPGLKLKLLPEAKFSPYAVGGVGYARFNSSDTLGAGGANPSDRGVNRAVLDYGFGLDVKVFPFVSLRGEVRDFYSGTPRFNVDVVDDKQHNYLTSAGIVIRF